MRAMPSINKSAWIREQPESISAKDVVTKAASAGIKLTIAQVYTARSVAKKSSAPKAKPGPKPKASAATAIGGGDEFTAFKRLVLTIGLAKADAYLTQLKQSVGL